VSVVEYPLFKYPPYTIALASEMARVTKRENLDFINVHYSLPHSTAAQLSREITKKPYITTLHGSDVTILGSDPSYEPINTMSIEASDAITTVSKYMAEEAKTSLGIEKEIHVIPNFVDEEIYQPAPCHLLETPRPRAITLVHVSNFRPVKRIEDLIYSMCILTKKEPNAQLILVGDGPDRHNIERLIDKLDLRRNIRVTGYRSDVAAMMNCADALVLCSETENAPLTILEGMSCGLPIIATNVGGIPEQVQDGVNGLLVPLKHPEEIAEAALKLNSDEKLLARMGENARKTVLEKYTKEIVLKQYLEVYNSVL
ncbi:N-acetyl-alpha-D-glucosaminyl L-malate synthase BshA, partial [Candidatus Bathyarchaeota archaeon]|nr:N-acetyl-alpha-D-glucosaminyl L-malate synthase BshA [Candidatus Bathyarchaeota archaeon]